jgi:hypothetical protein
MKSGNQKPAPIPVGSHKNKVLLEPRQVGVNDTHFIGSDPNLKTIQTTCRLNRAGWGFPSRKSTRGDAFGFPKFSPESTLSSLQYWHCIASKLELQSPSGFGFKNGCAEGSNHSSSRPRTLQFRSNPRN